MSESLLESYLRRGRQAFADLPVEQVAALAGLDLVARVAPEVARGIVSEMLAQSRSLKLIASENYSSLSTQFAMANLLTDKYAEGVPQKRFYAGCDNVDHIESYARDRARELFGAEHAYVQPHSGADANLVAFWAILSARVETAAVKRIGGKDAASLSPEDWETVRRELGEQRLLGMDLNSGGHLTHGYRLNVSARMFQAHPYTVDRRTHLLDYDQLERQARAVRPLILLAGYSAYPRAIDFERMREIADAVGAVLMVDMAHFAGLVAGKVLTGRHDPVPYAHVVTTTTHKTLRGPRGGLVLCTQEFAEFVDKGCPLVLGGPLPHVVAAKAVAFTEALRPEFRDYARRIVENARALAAALVERGQAVVSGGTDNHLVLLDVSQHGVTGRQAETALRECGITLNRNTVPFDPAGPWYTSGLRLGTPAVTTRGMGPAAMREIADLATMVLQATRPGSSPSGPSKAKYELDPGTRAEVQDRVARLLEGFPLYPELDLPAIEAIFGLRPEEEVLSAETAGGGFKAPT